MRRPTKLAPVLALLLLAGPTASPSLAGPADRGHARDQPRLETPADTKREGDIRRRTSGEPGPGEPAAAAEATGNRRSGGRPEAAGGEVVAEAVQTPANPGPITIPEVGTASPYPSAIQVTGFQTSVVDVDVTLRGFSHVSPDDVDVLLVGPAGQTAVVMSDVGALFDATALTLTLDDEADARLPDEGTPLVSGTFRPTNAGTDPDTFPGAPTAGSEARLSVFDGTDPNGPWRLFVVDRTGAGPDDPGAIAGGWSLRIETTNDAPGAKDDRFTLKNDKKLREGAPGVLRNDRDPDGDRLTAALVGRAKDGKVRLRPNGSFVYRPDRGFDGTDTFTYRVTDGVGFADRATVRVDVDAKRDDKGQGQDQGIGNGNGNGR